MSPCTLLKSCSTQFLLAQKPQLRTFAAELASYRAEAEHDAEDNALAPPPPVEVSVEFLPLVGFLLSVRCLPVGIALASEEELEDARTAVQTATATTYRDEDDDDARFEQFEQSVIAGQLEYYIMRMQSMGFDFSFCHDPFSASSTASFPPTQSANIPSGRQGSIHGVRTVYFKGDFCKELDEKLGDVSAKVREIEQGVMLKLRTTILEEEELLVSTSPSSFARRQLACITQGHTAYANTTHARACTFYSVRQEGVSRASTLS